MKLYLVRHAQAENNIDSDKIGGRDTKLTTIGIMQARRLGMSLLNEKIDAIYCSEIYRAKQTLDKMLSFVKPKQILYTSDINEISRGNITSWSQFLNQMNSSGLTQEDFRCEGGENFKDVVQRAENFWRILLEEHKDDTVVVVSHQVFIKLFVERVLKIPIGWEIGNASVSCFDVNESVVNYTLNKIDHLADLPSAPILNINLEKRD